MCSACLAFLLRRWFACGGGGGGEQHCEFPGLPRESGRLSSSQERTQLQLLAAHEMESCDSEVCTCIWDLWVKAMQCQSAHVPNHVGQHALTICLSTISGMDCKHDRCGAVLFDFFWGRRAPSIDCFCLRDHWWNALPAPCCVFSGGGAYGWKLALKSDSTVNFENCTSNSLGALGSTGKPHGERSRQAGF